MKTIHCPVCEQKTLALRTGPGRVMRHRLMEVAVPDDFPLPSCSNCGARPIDLKTAQRLDPVLEAAYERRLSELVSADLELLAAVRPLYEWERILGFSKGWLSKIREAKTPSPQLVGLIRLLANSPDRELELRELWSTPGAGHVVTKVAQAVVLSPIEPPPAKTQMRLVYSAQETQKAAA